MIGDWRPEPAETTDVLAAGPVRALAALLDQPAPQDELPALWHWLFHLEPVAQRDLGPDGHPAAGRFLPPIPDRRRMFAGARFRRHAPLRIGDEIVRRSELASVQAKTGRSGELLFTTVRHEFRRDGLLVAEEEQDLVYRSGGPVAAEGPVVAPEGPGLTQVSPAELRLKAGPALLFRFSALTYNAHRIHYDLAYATQAEGHRGLVVHGPLLAILLAELPRRAGLPVDELRFRLARPVLAGQEVVLRMEEGAASAVLPADETAVTLTFRSRSGEPAV